MVLNGPPVSTRPARWQAVSLPERIATSKQQKTMDVQVKSNGFDLGTMDECDVREVCRRKEGHIVRATPGQKWFPSFLVLHREATHRTRALCNTSTRSAMSPTQREELYSGSRREHTDGPVTAVLTVVRKPGKTIGRDMLGREVFEFKNWGETERFSRRRFNPDKIPTPIYVKAPQMRQARSMVA